MILKKIPYNGGTLGLLKEKKKSFVPLALALFFHS
jgi:hypothetical protein